MQQSESEQLQKTVHKIEHFPWLAKAHHLTRFLRDAVRALRTVAIDPDHMGLWIREATSTASVDSSSGYEKWFEHRAVSGKGFRRVDLMLYSHVLKACEKVDLLYMRIVTKNAEFEKMGRDMTGRQAILICRHFFKESALDRKHTDRRRFEAVKLIGDDVEGYWNTLSYTLAELDPANVPSDFELLDAALQEMRKSKRFSQQMDYWNLALGDHERTWMNLQAMIIKFIERTNELKTSQQIRDQPLTGQIPGGRGAAAMKPQSKAKAKAAAKDRGSAGARSTTPKKKGICFSWRSTGVCPRGEACQWDHPRDQQGSNPRDRRGASGGSGGSRKREQTTDPKRVCKLYLKGQCSKSHEMCGFIHNPTCWFFQQRGKCKQGDNCLFPHRGGKEVLIAKLNDQVTDKGQHVPPTDGKAGAHAGPTKAAVDPSPKAKAAPKKQTVAAKSQQPHVPDDNAAELR